MSKYDKLDYVSRFEEINKTYPECVKDYSKTLEIIPEELLEAVTVEELKNCLKFETEEDKERFKFFNNNQTVINKDYFKNARYFDEQMSPEDKKEVLIDYLIFKFGDKVDGKYFDTNLREIFDLNGNENYEENSFDFMIEKHFKKKEIDLNNEEERKQFKNFIEDDIKIYIEDNNINNTHIQKESEDNIINTKD